MESFSRVHRAEDFDSTLQDFRDDSDGRTWLRRGMRLRITARRLHRLLRAKLGPSVAPP